LTHNRDLLVWHQRDTATAAEVAEQKQLLSSSWQLGDCQLDVAMLRCISSSRKRPVRRQRAWNWAWGYRLLDQARHAGEQDDSSLKCKGQRCNDQADLGIVDAANDGSYGGSDWSRAVCDNVDCGHPAEQGWRRHGLAQRRRADDPEDRSDAKEKEAKPGKRN